MPGAIIVKNDFAGGDFAGPFFLRGERAVPTRSKRAVRAGGALSETTAVFRNTISREVPRRLGLDEASKNVGG